MPTASRAHGAMLVYAALISTSFPVGAAITHDLDPIVLTFLRFVVASMAFGAVVLAAGGCARPAPRDLLRYAVISLTMVVYFVTMFEGLRWMDPLSGGAMFTLVPLVAAGVTFLVNRQRCSPAQLACLVLGAAGAVWVLFDGRVDRLLAFSLGRGEAIFAVGCLAFACYAPAVRRLAGGESIMVLTFWTIVAGAVLLGIYTAPRLVATDWAAIPARAWLGIAYLAVFNTAGTFYLAKTASMALPGFKVMAYTYLTPAFVALLEGALGHGWPVWSVVVGIAVTGAATVLLQRIEVAEKVATVP